MSDNGKLLLLSNYKTLLHEYTKCMQPQLEYLRDRLNYNRVYVESNLEVFCQKERQNLQSNISELDKISK